MIAVGVARPSASGQVITTTLIANSSESLTSRPISPAQIKNVNVPAMIATSTSQNAARSASRWAGALEFCASCTSLTIWASAVSEPTATARARSALFLLIVAPTSLSPGPLCAGRLSPVTLDSSTSLSPSMTSASTGIFAPGRISSRSPTATSAVGTSTGSPSRRTTALGGERSSSARIESDAPPRARISNQCPSNTNVASIAPASKNTSPLSPAVTATL